uniref:Alternative protein CARD6 n=1 Tax=Homo sapiens TaxID=9606 RepID=L8EBB0_HUMAN|nr:alternative protein CARD6 [Homo sapiens]
MQKPLWKRRFMMTQSTLDMMVKRTSRIQKPQSSLVKNQVMRDQKPAFHWRRNRRKV